MNKRIIIQDLISDTGQIGNVKVIGDDTPGPTPTGTISITENGTYDVAEFAEAEVNVAGSGGAHLIASGTFVGDGAFQVTVPIGKKMPQTDFVFNVWVENNTQFERNDDHKFAIVQLLAQKRFSVYDLSTDGTKNVTPQMSYAIDASGTITTVSANGTVSYEYDIYNALTQYSLFGQPASNKIIRSQSGFSVKMDKSSAAYKFVSGMTYNWELLYIGSDPSNDIVEVA